MGKLPPLLLPKCDTSSHGIAGQSVGSSHNNSAARGTHQDLLSALQLRVAAAIEDTSAHPRDLAAPLSRQLLEISKDLQALNTARTERRPGRPSRGNRRRPWETV
jgi:hypothetical protein